jgi:protein-S-isoprenylcysteine O-methyltransferase Ste14
MLRRWLALAYGTAAYALFLAVFLYAIGFVGGFWTPTRLDGPLEGSLTEALLVNLVLLGLFAASHSVMARPWFKEWWTRIVPRPIERSTYVLVTNVMLIALFAYWQPMGGTIWNVENEVGRGLLDGLFAFGWLTVLVTTFLINHFDLFGLRQVWLYFRGRPYTSLNFATPGPYRWVRHPLYIGWMIAFWATSTMTAGHLTFALLLTLYMVVAATMEERDLVSHFGPSYESYRRRVPMFIPRLGAGAQKRRAAESQAVGA